MQMSDLAPLNCLQLQEHPQMSDRVMEVSQVEQDVTGLVEGYLQGPVNLEQPLAAQGMDSLALMELRQQLQVGSELLYVIRALNSGHVRLCKPSGAVISLVKLMKANVAARAGALWRNRAVTHRAARGSHGP